jgi:sialidase-1
LQGLAACQVPIFHAIGLNDNIVPNAENTYVLVNNYIKAGGIATVYPMTRGEQKSEGHHFPIEHPAQIADFIFRNSYPVKKALDPSTYHISRSNLNNSFLKFSRDRKGRVAFMGGSITEHGAWREKVCNYLKEKFPQTAFEFINAGISSTGSMPGAFRLETEVLSVGPIDLFFEEAAVNDRTNGFDNKGQIRGMEGIIRHARQSNPLMDIVMMHFVDPEKVEAYNKGIVPAEIVNHEKVAAHYKVNTINLAKEVTDRINAGEFNWKNDFKDLHPSPFGHEVYTASIKAFLNKAYSGDINALPTAHEIPSKLDKFSFTSGYYLPVDQAKNIKGWNLDMNWVPTDGVGTRPQYVNRPALIALEPGAEMTLAFEGTAIGICIATGPDAGMIEYSVDGKPFKKVDLITQWSGILHLPWYLMLEDELKLKKHKLVIRIASENNAKSKGHACRILHFLVNRN